MYTWLIITKVSYSLYDLPTTHIKCCYNLIHVDTQDTAAIRSCTNAYMLVYIRDSHIGNVICLSVSSSSSSYYYYYSYSGYLTGSNRWWYFWIFSKKIWRRKVNLVKPLDWCYEFYIILYFVTFQTFGFNKKKRKKWSTFVFSSRGI